MRGAAEAEAALRPPERQELNTALQHMTHANGHSLALAGRALGDGVAAALGALMQQPDAPLRRLDLRGNAIGDLGAARLADGIELNSTVTHLLLSDNAVTDQGARALAHALCRNRCLSELWLDGAQPPRQAPRVVAPWS